MGPAVDSMAWAFLPRPSKLVLPRLENAMPAPAPLAALHRDHLRQLTQRYQAALATEQLGGVVLLAGAPAFHFLDDTTASWKPNPHFSLFAPLPDAAGSAVLVPAEGEAVLLHLQPDDFWHAPPKAPRGAWLDALDFKTITSEAARDQEIAQWAAAQRGAVVTLGPGHRDPAGFRARVDFARAQKTPYELACLRAANRVAVKGHRAVQAGFEAGESEFALHLRYLAATDHEDHELPYTNIIGLDERGAILHYHHRRREAGPGESLLIDAGASYAGYAADITRSYARSPGPFQALIDAMDRLQQGLIAQLRPGIAWPAMQSACMGALAEVLVDSGLAMASKEAVLEAGLPECFMPHGLGHLLGIQVHDAGGQLADASGTLAPPPAQHPALRLTRTLEEDVVVTVEPGLYFIPRFLKALREGPHHALLNWPLVEAMTPYGGIRIEDNVRITADGVENFTRDAFAAEA